MIYGHNGLDLDVTFNLRSFYKQLGFSVFFSGKLHDADLLVVLRAVDKPIDISPFSFSLVHVYDYGGWDYDEFVKSINQKITYIFCTTESKLKRLVDILHFPKEQVFVALPPVDIKIWCKKLENVRYDFIHIGNSKPNLIDDPINELFNKALSYFKVHVWGSGWNLVNNTYHGKIGLFDVSNIYSKSRFSFGLMYPFQREVTFSGRFWHGPLNGCVVLSEHGLFTRTIPGIVETEYRISEIERLSEIFYDRYELQSQSIMFWNKQFEVTLNLVKPTLILIGKNTFTISKAISYLYYSNLNLLREYYQRFELFKLRFLRNNS